MELKISTGKGWISRASRPCVVAVIILESLLLEIYPETKTNDPPGLFRWISHGNGTPTLKAWLLIHWSFWKYALDQIHLTNLSSFPVSEPRTRTHLKSILRDFGSSAPLHPAKQKKRRVRTETVQAHRLFVAQRDRRAWASLNLQHNFLSILWNFFTGLKSAFIKDP